MEDGTMYEPVEETGSSGAVDLFYVIDFGDHLANGWLSSIFKPVPAMIVGHVASFAVNAGLWITALYTGKTALGL